MRTLSIVVGVLGLVATGCIAVTMTMSGLGRELALVLFVALLASMGAAALSAGHLFLKGDRQTIAPPENNRVVTDAVLHHALIGARRTHNENLYPACDRFVLITIAVLQKEPSRIWPQDMFSPLPLGVLERMAHLGKINEQSVAPWEVVVRERLAKHERQHAKTLCGVPAGN